MIPTRIGVIESTGAAFKIEYTLAFGSPVSADLEIYVNSILVVDIASSLSGNIIVNPGDSIQVNAAGSGPNAISMTLTVTNNGTTVYSNTQSGDLSYTDSYTYTATGNGTVYVLVGEI